MPDCKRRRGGRFLAAASRAGYGFKTPMNALRSFLFLLVLTTAAQAADWKTFAATPAAITVINMEPRPLVKSSDENGWLTVPDNLTRYAASIYFPVQGQGGGTNGVADITVVKSGYLLLACNYYYQGNSSGDWQKEVWDAKEFKRKGWRPLTKTDLGGLLLNHGNQEQTVFYKKVEAGQNVRLRCNKYQPPYPIVLGSVK